MVTRARQQYHQCIPRQKKFPPKHTIAFAAFFMLLTANSEKLDLNTAIIKKIAYLRACFPSSRAVRIEVHLDHRYRLWSEASNSKR